MNFIHDDFKQGDFVKLGHFVVIESDVVVMEHVKIGHRVTLKSGTRVCEHSIIDDHCITTGACYIGRNVNVRTGAIISRATIIEDNCFIGPGVITNHTKHVTHGRESQVEPEEVLTYIGYGSIIGSQASILAGITIGPQTIVGGGSVVIKDLEGYGVYVGNPCRRLTDLPPDYRLTGPEDEGRMYMTEEIVRHLKKYNVHLRVSPPQ